MKIEKSKQQNQLRIDKMRKVNEYVEMLKKETTNKIREQMKGDAGAYKTLLKDLLVQVSIFFLFYLTLRFFLGIDQAYGGKRDYQMQTKGQGHS